MEQFHRDLDLTHERIHSFEGVPGYHPRFPVQMLTCLGNRETGAGTKTHNLQQLSLSVSELGCVQSGTLSWRL